MPIPISESLLDEETDLAKMEVLKMMNVNKGAQSWGDDRCSTSNHGLGLCQPIDALMLMETRQAHWPE